MHDFLWPTPISSDWIHLLYLSSTSLLARLPFWSSEVDESCMPLGFSEIILLPIIIVRLGSVRHLLCGLRKIKK